eukprot:COSAG03_NODE_1767_length_3550_cov_10.837438_3_plen_45_part_00
MDLEAALCAKGGRRVECHKPDEKSESAGRGQMPLQKTQGRREED